MTAIVKERIPLAQATRIAAELMELLHPACERIDIAGSIRRRRPDVADVELVLVPRITPTARDLFGNVVATENELDTLCQALKAQGLLRDRPDRNGTPAWGSRHKRALYKGFPVDLFSVIEPAQHGVVMVLRTGCAEFSKRVVTQAKKGGSLPDRFFVRDGALWETRWGEEPRLIPTPTEMDFSLLLECRTCGLRRDRR